MQLEGESGIPSFFCGSSPLQTCAKLRHA